MKETMNQTITRPSKEAVTALLHDIGLPEDLNSYYYLLEALTSCDPVVIPSRFSITKVYADIAEKYNTTPANIERSLRYAVSRLWNPSMLSPLLEELFGYTISPDKGAPTNKEFFVLLLNYLYANMEKEDSLTE